MRSAWRSASSCFARGRESKSTADNATTKASNAKSGEYNAGIHISVSDNSPGAAIRTISGRCGKIRFVFASNNSGGIAARA